MTLVGNKYLRVEFNSALKSLESSEITIRDSKTQELAGVKSVTLASDGLSAQVELLGAEDTNAIDSQKDYVFTITKSGKTSTFTFHLPLVVPNVVITTTDAINNTVGGAKLADDVTVDFEDVLGRTATVWYNKNNEITKFVFEDQAVKFDGIVFNIKDNTRKVTTLTEEKEYNLAQTGFRVIGKAANNTEVQVGYVNDTKFNSAKLLFNAKGEVQTIIVVDKFNTEVLAESVKDSIVTGYKSELNLNKYTIVKDGKTIKVSDIKAGDLVQANTSYKYAEVFSKTVVGKINAVYAGNKFKVGDKIYEHTTNGRTTFYIKDGKQTALDLDGLKSLEASKKDVTLHLDRSGNIIYVTGDLGTVIALDKFAYLTEDAKAYDSKGEKTISLEVVNQDGTKSTETFAISQLKSFVKNDVDYLIGKKIDVAALTTYATELSALNGVLTTDINSTLVTGTDYVVGKLVVTPNAADSTKFDVTVNYDLYVAAGTLKATGGESTVRVIDGNQLAPTTTLNKDDSVKITKDGDAKVTGLELATKVASANITNNIKVTDKIVTHSGGTVQIKSSTPIFFKDGKVITTGCPLQKVHPSIKITLIHKLIIKIVGKSKKM